MGVNSKCGVQCKRKCESQESCVCIVGFSVCGCQKTNITCLTSHGTRSLLPATKGPVLFDCWDRGTVEQCPSALPEVLGRITYTDGCPQGRGSHVWPSVGQILPQRSITSYAVFGIGQSKFNYRTHRCAYVVYCCYCCNVSCIAIIIIIIITIIIIIVHLT